MSVAVMGAVFRLPIPPSEKVVALALADHAHDDGTEARPGTSSLAVKSSLSKRQVQRVLKSLVAKGVIQVYREATYTTPAWYRFILDKNGNLANFPVDNLSPGSRHPGPKEVSPVTQTVDTSVTRTVKNRYEPKGQVLQFPNEPSLCDFSDLSIEEQNARHDAAAKALRNIRKNFGAIHD